MIVDVILPVFNAELTIEESLASIQTQTVTDIRIIVINDGSTDSTLQIVSRLAKDDTRIMIVNQENKGIVCALNVGLGFCIAPYIARHDADDIAFNERFASQIEFLANNLDYVAVSGNVWHINAAGARTGGRSFYLGDVKPDPLSAPSREPYLMHPFLMARRAAMITSGGYRHVFHAEDTDLYWRLHELGGLHSMSDILGEYRVHSGSISGRSIHNGRLQATYSQLAAISHIRRTKGLPDLVFDKEDSHKLANLLSLDLMLATCSGQLEVSEISFLNTSTAAKLLELASYRPYYLERSDCSLINRIIFKRKNALTAQDRMKTNWDAHEVVVRLIRKFAWRELISLGAPSEVWIIVGKRFLKKAVRYALGFLVRCRFLLFV